MPGRPTAWSLRAADLCAGGQPTWTRLLVDSCPLGSLALAAYADGQVFMVRATRRLRAPPSDAEIERGRREKAVTAPRAAEILLRWLQRARPPEATPGVDLDAMSEARLERLHAGVKLASMDETVLAALVDQVLAGDEPASSS